jgi:hypothetical protein
MKTRHLLALAAVFLSGLPAFAQVTGSMSGLIEDATSSPVGSATVTIRSLETGAARTTQTDSTGHFQATALPLGQQEVKVEKMGFKTQVRTGVNLAVGQEAVVNVKLEVGEISQQVTISEEAPLINTTTADVSGMVTSREVKDLPLNGRSFDNLITLNAGAIGYALKSAQTTTSNGNTFAVSGRRPSDNIFLLNGIEYTGSSQLAVTPGGASGQLLGIDAVREFNLLADTYSAEYGKRAGGQVTVVTQSGTNSLHGSMFEFLRNSALDARNFFDRGSVPPFRRNQFGGSLGGPLKKDKLFLFGNYEGFRQVLAVSNISVVPDAQVRQGFLPNATTGIYSKPANLNTAILKYMQMWPDPNGAELTVGGIPSGTAFSYNNPRQVIHENFGTTRLDYNISSTDTFSSAYTVDDGNSILPQADPLFASGLNLRMQVASLEETHVFSPRALNTFRFGFSRAAYANAPIVLGTFTDDLSFVKGGAPGGIIVNGGVTTAGASGITAAGTNNAAGAWNRRNLFTVTDNFHITTGRHQITFGGWMQRVQDNENSASRTLGQATFASLATLLSATVTTFQVVPAPNELGWRAIFGAWFVQDAFRIRPNLTVEFGLRHEFTNGWNELSGRAANYITDGNNVLLTNPINGVFTQNNAKKLFAPRVGIAWDVRGDGKTSIRAGFGTYYSLIDNLAFLINSLPPWNGAASYSGVSLPSVLPVIPGVMPPPTCSPTVSTNCSTFAPQGVQPDAKTLAVQQWSVRIEQQITPSLAFRIGYVGSHGTHSLISVDPNSIPAQVCANASGCLAGGTGAVATATSTVPQGTYYIPSPGTAPATRPNRFLGAGFFWYAEGNTSYNALETEISKRLSHGLQIRGNFTWSKNLDMNSALTIAQGNNQPQMVMDRNNVLRDYGPSALNVAAQSSISGRYELPFLKSNRYLGGWQLNGIVTMLSGFPFTPQVGSNRSGDGDTRNPDRPNLNPNFTGPIVTGNPNQWFNPAAFVAPAFGTYGNLGRGTFRGPGLAALDMSLFKDFAVVERMHLQFRAEMFNVLNHANFAAPNAIVFSTPPTVSPSAGLITSTVTQSRQMQFGLKLIF